MRKALFAALFLGVLLFVEGCILGTTISITDQANRKIVASIFLSGAAILSFAYAGLLVETFVSKIKNGWFVLIICYPFFTLLGTGLIILASRPELIPLLLTTGRRCLL